MLSVYVRPPNDNCAGGGSLFAAPEVLASRAAELDRRWRILAPDAGTGTATVGEGAAGGPAATWVAFAWNEGCGLGVGVPLLSLAFFLSSRNLVR